jgi:hypothetical protein
LTVSVIVVVVFKLPEVAVTVTGVEVPPPPPLLPPPQPNRKPIPA